MPTKTATDTEVELVKCNNCYNDTKKDEALKQSRMSYSTAKRVTRYYCDDCTFCCNDCDERTPQDEARSINGDNSVCKDCNESYRDCNNCGHTFHEDSVEWRNGDDGYCEDCSGGGFPRRAWTADEKLTKGKQGKIMQSTRLFGLEAEMGYGDNHRKLNEVAKAISENIGIYPDSGAEFQTPPASGDKAEALIEHMCDEFNKANFTARDGQGLHVHIDASELKAMNAEDRFNRIQGLWLFYVVFDEQIRKLTNSYRQRQAKSGSMFGINTYSFDEIAALTCLRDIDRKWYREDNTTNIDSYKREKKNGTRYKGFNLHALLNGYHLEIRYHESVTEARKMLEWANLHCLIMDKAIKGIDRAWLDQIRTKRLRGRAMFEYIGLSESSRHYFLTKKIKCAV